MQCVHWCFKILLKSRFVLRRYSPRHFRVCSLGDRQPCLFVFPTQGNGTGELLWQIGLNSRKQILRGFMANPIQLADFWTGTRRAAGRKRFLNVLTKNVWNAGNREMSDELSEAKHWTKIPHRRIYTRPFEMSIYSTWGLNCCLSKCRLNTHLFCLIGSPSENWKTKRFLSERCLVTLYNVHCLFFLQSFVRKSNIVALFAGIIPTTVLWSGHTYWPMWWYRAHVYEYSLHHSVRWGRRLRACWWS